VGGHEGYITVGMYDDGKPGEIFIKMAKEGSTLSGIMDAFALSVSISLQYGVPLRALVDKFCNSRFEPSGYTGNPKIRYAKSVVDYIGRWLGGKFISPDYLDHDDVAGSESGTEVESVAAAGVAKAPAPTAAPRPAEETTTRPRAALEDAPYCSECGMLMTPNGSCYKCSNCGSTSGCS
jgi:ribonucleoside-diphosphate reductase alpha chain